MSYKVHTLPYGRMHAVARNRAVALAAIRNGLYEHLQQAKFMKVGTWRVALMLNQEHRLVLNLPSPLKTG